MLSPKRRPLNPPSTALLHALQNEAAEAKGPHALTKLAWAAVDTIADAREVVVESLLAYLDTDALCYFAENPDLYARQQQRIIPILEGLQRRFDVHIHTTQGLLPLSQSEELYKRMQAYMQAMDDYRLSALLALTQLAGSLLLAVAFAEGLASEELYLSTAWIEEDFQRERNGDDDEAGKRRAASVAEARAAFRFMRLLTVPA